LAIELDVQVLSTTSWTVHLQTGSQEVRGFESLRLHPKVLVTAVCRCADPPRAGANVANCSHTAGTGVRKESCLRLFVEDVDLKAQENDIALLPEAIDKALDSRREMRGDLCSPWRGISGDPVEAVPLDDAARGSCSSGL